MAKPRGLSNLVSSLHNIIDNVGNFSYGLLGTFTTSRLAVNTLPIFGLTEGVLDIVECFNLLCEPPPLPNKLDNFYHALDASFSSSQPCLNNPGIASAKALSGLLLIITSARAIKEGSFTVGSPAYTGLCGSLAVKAAIDFAIAVYDYKKFSKVERHDSLYKIKKRAAGALAFAKLLDCIGWSVLAAGNPYGWVFLVAAGLAHAVKLNQQRKLSSTAMLSRKLSSSNLRRNAPSTSLIIPSRKEQVLSYSSHSFPQSQRELLQQDDVTFSNGSDGSPSPVSTYNRPRTRSR